LAPRSALVIGNSDGIGLAFTELLLAEGWSVTGLSRSPSRVSAPHYTHHVVDVCAPQYPRQLATAVSHLAALDACVYCVGVGEFVDVDTLSADRGVFEANLIGAVTTAQAVIPAMVLAQHGHFIGLSSQADTLIDAKAPSYAASKAGLSSYLEALAVACRPRGVYVTNLRFGFVDTKMAKADVRPFMISPKKAALRIRHCIAKKPMRDTFPKRMALLLVLVRLGSRLRRWFGQ
jgi:NAD(P)-dependent dehydrogenase (short-subunit alcohol dehydrogenase family)